MATERLLPFAIDERDNKIIRLPKAPLEGGGIDDWYRPERDGHLHCPGCNARVHFVKAAHSMDGSAYAGNDNHFKTNPKSPHDEKCDIGKKRRVHEKREKPDRSLGAVINLNSLVFERVDPAESPAGYLTRSFGHAADPTKQGMERVSMRSLGALLQFIFNNPAERINKSVVRFQGQEIPFSRYVMSHDNSGESLKALVKQLRASGQSAQAVLFDVDHSRIEKGRNSGKRNMIKMDAVYLQKDKKGLRHYIVPRFFIDHFAGNGPRIPFWNEGHSLVQGIAKYKCEEAKSIGCVFHYVSMELHSGIQVMPHIGMAELKATVKSPETAQKLNPKSLFGFGFR